MKNKIVRLPMGQGADKRFCEELVKRKNEKPKIKSKNETYESCVELILKGYNVLQIAEKLNLPPQNINYHIRKYNKLNKQ